MIAVGIFVVAATAAAVFLRQDAGLRVVRSNDLTRVAADVVEIRVPAEPACDVVERAQVDVDDETVFIELVVRDGGRCEQVRDLLVSIELPVPLADRRLLPGAGRTELPCVDDGSGRLACAAG